ncbi:putative stress-responsive nuclear envelope protein [Hirsutella rhossiliensis]|uniref:Stress-responsive nuclear envelope protein n=1 Tax=Hirsutella rhossiliensis TaxID=111463 RepID=A0A9P8N731_9HYPO|nr:putative stress-responsive nuclear envelope protein [Hirsutella rhossiliensis]KAH0967959.1 putative stress-responsive nuclear envelope protein [Hirsutella rhossiliensis]
MKSKSLVLAFGGMIAAAAAWAIWGSDVFPPERDPTGDPETWTRGEMRRWLAARNLVPQDGSTREELLARVLANMRIPRT